MLYDMYLHFKNKILWKIEFEIHINIRFDVEYNVSAIYQKFPLGYDLTDAKTFTKCVIAVSKTKSTFW